MFKPNVLSPTTPEEREDLILQIIEKHDGIGVNRLQKETEIPKKTLYKYLKEMIKKKAISKIKKGKKPNSPVVFAVNFSEKTKNTIRHNLNVASRQHWAKYKTKVQRSNTFPHYMQQLAQEYYQYMLFYIFDQPHAYRFALKRLEENLESEKKSLFREFRGKALARIFLSCHEVGFNLFTTAQSSMRDAGARNKHRTSDEIRLDFMHTPELGMDAQFDAEKEYTRHTEEDRFFESLDESRIDLISDRKTKEKFIELAKKYDSLSHQLTNIKAQITELTGAFPFESRFV